MKVPSGHNKRIIMLVAILGSLVSLILGQVWFKSLRLTLFPPGKSVHAAEYNETCLDPASKLRPVWECYEISLDKAVTGPITIRHSDGETHQTLAFDDAGQTKFRFTPSQPGNWSFSVGGSIDISSIRPDYAKGFVVANGINWTRSATGEAFVPQYLMYNRADLDEGLQEFVVEHGFTGFHITNLRDFLKNISYFEAIVLKTYRLGGVTHFWIWGDKSRGQTPTTYGVDTDILYREIASRLGPIPGWTVGYGFDLFEWASAKEIEQFQSYLHQTISYRHMLGARGYKNKYRQISHNLDYVSWEWHQPTLDDYKDHIKYAKGKPAFSEDRFRVRQPTRYPEKDYDFEKTRKGLWHSVLAGGVANIWGYKPKGKTYSEPYPNKEAIRTYRKTIDRYFEAGMTMDDKVLDDGTCLGGTDHLLCYAENANRIRFQKGGLDKISSILAIDTKQAYREITIDSNEQVTELATTSDWAIILIKNQKR
jgi:hypothetical protein